MKAIKYISVLLVIIGGLNWGLVGIFDFNLVGTILANMAVLARVVYACVGFATVYFIATMAPKLLKE